MFIPPHLFLAVSWGKSFAFTFIAYSHVSCVNGRNEHHYRTSICHSGYVGRHALAILRCNGYGTRALRWSPHLQGRGIFDPFVPQGCLSLHSFGRCASFGQDPCISQKSCTTSIDT